jgi:small subunit ribosomal protein S17
MADEETPETTEETPAAVEPEAEAAAPEAAASEAAEPEAPAEPVTPLTPKERRAARRARSRTARKPSTPEERAADRARKAAQRRRYRARLKTKSAERREDAPAAEVQHAPEHGPGKPKVRQGVVISSKADKTISVRIDVAKRHRRYRKIMRTSTTLYVHDERNDANEGDTVRVVECRPMSRSKRWRLTDVLERAK